MFPDRESGCVGLVDPDCTRSFYFRTLSVCAKASREPELIADGGREGAVRRVRCRECSAAVWTENDVWCLCDVCDARIWIDYDHPEAPPDLPAWLVDGPGGSR